MPIHFACPGCTRQLRSDRQRAGDEVQCPGCGQRIIVPNPPDRARLGILVEDGPTLPSAAAGVPEPQPGLTVGGRCTRRPLDDRGDDEDPIWRRRRQAARLHRRRLLSSLLVVSVLAVGCAVLVPRAIERLRNARDPVAIAEPRRDQPSRQSAGTWAGPLNETERKIVGEWTAVVTVVIREHRHLFNVNMVYRGDRTFSATVANTPQTGPELFTVEGTWRVDGGNLVTRVTGSSLPEMIPVGYSSADLVVSISDTTLITKDSATREQEVAHRTRK